MLIKRNDGTVDLQITVPIKLAAVVTYGIYSAIADCIEADDPLAKDLVTWYSDNIGISAKSLKQALEKKEVK